MKSAQHPGTVSTRVMARVLGVTEERMKFAARMKWVPCKWTHGHRAKFDPDEVLKHLGDNPNFIKYLRPKIGYADIPDAALWAMDAITMGIRGVYSLPSSIALALYIWGKQSKEHQDILVRFLLTRGFDRYMWFPLTKQLPRDGDSIHDDFGEMMGLLECEGLAFRRKASRRAGALLKAAKNVPWKYAEYPNPTWVSEKEMSHILGVPIQRLEQIACLEDFSSNNRRPSRKYCVEEVIHFILENDLPIPAMMNGSGTRDEAMQWAADAYYGIRKKPLTPSRLAWHYWLKARCSPTGLDWVMNFYISNRCAE